MPLLPSLIFSILQCLTLNVYIIKSREYFIIEGERPSYLYRKFDHVDEVIFPKDITIEAAFSKVIGTLLYSIDRNLNQFIVTLRDDFHQESQYGLEVVLNTQEIYVTLSSLCVCATCPFDFLKEFILRFQVDWNYISIQCNGRNPQKFRNERRRILDRNYPVLFHETYSWTRTDNKAHLWLVNHPIIGDIYPNTYQMHGCIFSVHYKEEVLVFTNISTNVGTKCKKSCMKDMCHGGECHVVYNSETICNCTKAFSNGRFCNNTMKSFNFRATSQSLLLKNIKLSWRSDVDDIFELKNTFVRIAFLRSESNLFFEYNYTDHRKNSSKVILTSAYVKNGEYISVVYFRKTTIDIRLFSTSFSVNIHIPSPSNIGEEFFHTITLRSGDGVIDLVYKTNMEDEWSEPLITNRIDIKRNLVYKTNMEDKWSEPLITNRIDIKRKMTENLEIKISVLIILLLFLVVVIPLFILCKRKRDDLKIYNTKARQLLFPLENEDFLDKSKYSKDMPQEDMGIDCATSIPMLTDDLLRKQYNLFQDHRGEYTKELVKVFIHVQLSSVKSILKCNEIKFTPKNKPHLENLIYLLSKKYEYSINNQRLLIDVMMDFLEDVSKYYLHSNNIHSLIESIMSYVGYYTIVNKYEYDYDITFLGHYLHKDNNIKVWTSVILCVSENNLTHVKLLEAYIYDEYLENRITHDVMVIYMALLWTRANNNCELTFTNIDYRIILAIREWNVALEWPVSKSMLQIFWNKNWMIIECLKNESKTDSQKIFLNCLFVCLNCGIWCENNLDIMISILDIFNPHITKDIIATRIVEVIMYHLCVYIKNRNEPIKSRILAIGLNNYVNENVIEEIKISSSLIICYYTYVNPSIYHVTKIKNNLSGIQKKLEEQHSNNYLGFYRFEITEALSKITNMLLS